jgi:hypothetical protein
MVSNVSFGPMCHESTVTRKACHRHCKASSQGSYRRRKSLGGIFHNTYLVPRGIDLPEQLGPGLAVRR